MGKMNYHESMHTTSRDEQEAHIIEILRAFEKEQKAGKVKYL
jgi:hypothetical protein